VYARAPALPHEQGDHVKHDTTWRSWRGTADEAGRGEVWPGRERVTRWQSLLTTHTKHGRQLLREMLAGPIMFTPDATTYRFEGEATMGPLLSGEIAGSTVMVPVRGFEPRFDG
jgi:hypothetical protein